MSTAELMMMANAIVAPTVSAPVARRVRVPQFLPTTVCLREFAQAACQALLGNPTPEADRVFNAARNHAGSFYLPKGTRLIRARSFEELSGLDSLETGLRVGRPQAIAAWLATNHQARISPLAQAALDMLSGQRRDALVVANAKGELGVIAL